MRRREFITLVSGAAAWPFAARAQRRAMPVVGLLNLVSPEGFTERLSAYRQGLKEAGYIEGENVIIEYRWGVNQIDRLPALAADLVRRQVAVIAAFQTESAQAAKAATATIPIVFATGTDPVARGLVASLNRPGGNATGINYLISELSEKRLGLLRELTGAGRVAVLVDQTAPVVAEAVARDVEAAARAMGLQIKIFNVSSSDEILTAFERLEPERPDALYVGTGTFVFVRRVQLAMLAARHGLPSSFSVREMVEAGGLMSYGTNLNDALRQAGAYTGRILKGANPADLPVVQSSRFEFVINLATAKMLRLSVPPSLLAIADGVIE